MTYLDTVKYLKSLINYEGLPKYCYKKSFGIKRLKGFLSFIGNPQDKIRFIHIVGSKGKGSTSIFIAYILKEAGYKVGLYTSPHLIDLRERIRVLPGKRSNEFEGMISKNKLRDLVKKMKPAIELYNRISLYGGLTFFEVCTALAIKYFKEAKVDFAVLEAGLGGRFDATNVVNALICVVTPISYEHMDKLGKTLGAIAKEKVAIIKGGELAVISALQKKEVKRVIGLRCKKKGVRLIKLKKCRKLRLKLRGRHQLVNANTALKAIKALSLLRIDIKDNCIKRGVYKAIWPARCEVVGRRPYIVLDGAQNAASAEAIKRTIKEEFRYRKLILVLGISADKDIRGVCSNLYSLADKVVLTKASNLRGVEPDLLTGYFKGKEVYKSSSVSQARRLSRRLAGKNDLILVTGSLFVTGEFKYGINRYN
jgi:dihydrofolate synthase / folylpolyglutamate synthase